MENYTFTTQYRFRLDTLVTYSPSLGLQPEMNIQDDTMSEPTPVLIHGAAFRSKDGFLEVGTIEFLQMVQSAVLDMNDGTGYFLLMRSGGGFGISDIRVGFKESHFWDLSEVPIRIEVRTGQYDAAVWEVSWPIPEDPDPTCKPVHSIAAHVRQ